MSLPSRGIPVRFARLFSTAALLWIAVPTMAADVAADGSVRIRLDAFAGKALHIPTVN